MNSILQCISNTPPLAHYFVSRYSAASISDTNTIVNITLTCRSFEEDINDKYSKTRGHIAQEFAEVRLIIIKC